MPSPTSSYPGSPKKASVTPWQDKLLVACQDCNLEAPSFQIFSDRRGGRTAWTSHVSVYGTVFTSRFWYDGKNINNAKEDAAEQAVNWLTNGSNPSSPSTTRSGW